MAGFVPCDRLLQNTSFLSFVPDWSSVGVDNLSVTEELLFIRLSAFPGRGRQ